MRLLLKNNFAFSKRAEVRAVIKQSTKICNDHLTPEIKLRLITPSCSLWNSRPEKCVFLDPFWAFYWPGGQALSRYILDNKYLVKDKCIIDIGSGCGACAIAAASCGAKSVIANDLDPVACEAISMNADINRTKVHIYDKNVIGQILPFKVDVILVGDMFYDQNFGEMLFEWLCSYKNIGLKILIGDPGRHALAKSKRNKLTLQKEYPLMYHTVLENNGFLTSSVWEM